jgi:EAL domain-containing protein (putative c-di-GMP-specific phosphodiesterase class I)
MIGKSADTINVLRRLSDLSVLTIDAFGTGYSWLVNLKKLPINQIKIDKTFIMDMMASVVDTELVSLIINFAHNLGLKVVPEGVEDEETLDRLAAVDCDVAQGYFMAPPLTAQEFTQWLSESPYGLKAA